MYLREEGGSREHRHRGREEADQRQQHVDEERNHRVKVEGLRPLPGEALLRRGLRQDDHVKERLLPGNDRRQLRLAEEDLVYQMFLTFGAKIWFGFGGIGTNVLK